MDETLGDYYYFNFETGETQWSHPLDKIYCEKVIKARINCSKQDDVSGDQIENIFKTKDIDDKSCLINRTESNSNSKVLVEAHDQLDPKDLSCTTEEQKEQEMNLTPKKLVSEKYRFTGTKQQINLEFKYIKGYHLSINCCKLK